MSVFVPAPVRDRLEREAVRQQRTPSQVAAAILERSLARSRRKR